MQTTADTTAKPGWVLVQFVTLARIPAAAIFAIVLLTTTHAPPFVWVCFGLLSLVEFSDLADGFLARRYGLVSEWGAMLDPYSDSVSRLIVYWGLAMAGFVLPFVPLVMALRDVTVSYCRIVLTKAGRTVSARVMGKIKAWVQGIAAFLALGQPLFSDFTGAWTLPAISWLVAGMTAASVWSYAGAAIAATREKNAQLRNPAQRRSTDPSQN